MRVAAVPAHDENAATLALITREIANRKPRPRMPAKETR